MHIKEGEWTGTGRGGARTAVAAVVDRCIGSGGHQDGGAGEIKDE